jgi:hypothetical protein
VELPGPVVTNGVLNFACTQYNDTITISNATAPIMDNYCTVPLNDGSYLTFILLALGV